jgi:hypothetical protein
MTRTLDAIDRLPTLVWALVVMLSAWAVIALGAVIEVAALTALKGAI